MVVRENHGIAVCAVCKLSQLPDGHLRGRRMSLSDDLTAQNAQLFIEQRRTDDLALLEHININEEFADLAVIIQLLADHLRACVILCHGAEQRQQNRRILADIRLLHQILRIGGKNSMQTAEAVKEPVRDLIGITPRNAVIQQHFQHLMRLESGKAGFKKSAAHSAAVTAVNRICHILRSSPDCFIRRYVLLYRILHALSMYSAHLFFGFCRYLTFSGSYAIIKEIYPIEDFV